MRKIGDFYFAGVIIGAVTGILFDLAVLLFIWAGVKMRTPWTDMAELLFNPPQVYTWSARLLGVIISLGVSITNGILIALLLRLTGRDYIYVKSVSVILATGFFAFTVLYPALGLKFLQRSLATNYVGLLLFTLFGLLNGYLFKRYTLVGERELYQRE